MLAGISEGETARVMDHHHGAGRHGDGCASHGDQRGGRRGNAFDDNIRDAGARRQQRVDCSAFRRNAAARIQMNIEVGLAVDLRERNDHISGGKTVIVVILADIAGKPKLSAFKNCSHLGLPQ